MYIVPVFGITGVGKSQLCNFLFQDITNTKFKVGHGNDSETTIKNLIEQDSLGLPILENKFCLIDTPGGDDSKGKDIENLEEIAKFLQKKGKVHCILLVFSFTVRNKQGAVTEYLKKLSTMFTPMEFYSHVIIILTNYPLKPRKIEEIKRQTYVKQINNIIRECFRLNDKVEKDHYYIDTLPLEDDNGNQYFDKETQIETRNSIIKEMTNICKSPLIKPIENITWNKEQMIIKEEKEKEFIKNTIDKMNRDPKFKQEIIKKVKEENNNNKEFKQECINKNVNRTFDNDEMCLCGKIATGIAIGAGCLIASPVLAVGGLFIAASSLICDECNIF